MDDLKRKALELHSKNKGKVSILPKVKVETKDDLSLAYTPGVAEPCREIAADKGKVYDYTFKSNTVAVVSDGSAVLGLGNIGAEAALPVMEGKCVLFKRFSGIDAWPICIKSQEPRDIIEVVKNIAPVFGGINLEDIAAPKCFEIEEVLKKELDIPVMHDDQHGTAIVVLAAVFNALKVVGIRLEEAKFAISGVGAAGVATARLLLKAGAKDIIMTDTRGAIYEGRKEHMNQVKEGIAHITNKEKVKGSLKEVLEGRNVFIGLSSGNLLDANDIKKMENAVIIAMANPVPEIMPDESRKGGAKIIATGRSDFPNQVNNSLAFPGVFRGALDCRAREINDEMKLEAAYALASIVKKPAADMIIPGPFDKDILPKISEAVVRAARKTGVARL
ncbi:NAD-dependent malic enzyme [Candidatus Woesearchaeota archaeon]|nr:NAD-dependent malic enzyme [Candidatus Woesearchaeota archaeon]